MQYTFWHWLLQGFPECLALVAFGWILLERKFVAKKILALGLLQAGVACLVRVLPVSFGIHTLILVFSLAVLLAYFSNNYYSRVLFVSLLAFVVLGLFELVVLTASSRFLGLSADAVLRDPLLSILLGLPQSVFLFLSALLVARLKKRNNILKAFR